MSVPGVDAIQQSLGIESEKAKQVHDAFLRCLAGQLEAEQAMEELNDVLDFHGVEAITGDYHVDRYHFNIVATYCNAGDSYRTTVLYETETGEFHLVSWGDWVEQNQEKYRIV